MEEHRSRRHEPPQGREGQRPRAIPTVQTMPLSSSCLRLKRTLSPSPLSPSLLPLSRSPQRRAWLQACPAEQQPAPLACWQPDWRPERPCGRLHAAGAAVRAPVAVAVAAAGPPCRPPSCPLLGLPETPPSARPPPRTSSTPSASPASAPAAAAAVAPPVCAAGLQGRDEASSGGRRQARRGTQRRT